MIAGHKPGEDAPEGGTKAEIESGPRTGAGVRQFEYKEMRSVLNKNWQGNDHLGVMIEKNKLKVLVSKENRFGELCRIITTDIL